MGIHFPPPKEMQMAFDAKQAVTDEITELDDKLKQAKTKADRDAADNAAAVADLESQIDGWQKLLACYVDQEKAAAKKTPKK